MMDYRDRDFRRVGIIILALAAAIFISSAVLAGLQVKTFYLDADADGYGDPAISTTGKKAPPGYVSDNTDCDDTDSLVNPGAAGSCADGGDNNCDGLVGCNDPGCEGDPASPSFSSSEAGLCGDGSDNDCDGLADCADTADCVNAPACTGDVAAWLAANPEISNAIVWQSPTTGIKAYPEWTTSQQTEFHDAFAIAWSGGVFPLPDPVPNALVLDDTINPLVVLDQTDAWQLYIAYVANSLAVEIGDRTPWSLKDLPPEHLEVILDSTQMFIYHSDYSAYGHPGVSGYEISFYVQGPAVPAPPDFTFNFLADNGLIGPDQTATIGLLLDWSRNHMEHFIPYDITVSNYEAHWQYRGFPPVSRVINKTINANHPEQGLKSWTAGCYGTTAFLRAVLRAVNIPVRRVMAGGHTTPHFSSIGMYLSHGDDPYFMQSYAIPPFPAEELLIDQTTFDAWFGDKVRPAKRGINVSLRTYELSVDYISDYLMFLHCRDLAAGRDHRESEVWAIFEYRDYYRLRELEEMQLWERIEAKIATFGGCAYIPKSWQDQ